MITHDKKPSVKKSPKAIVHAKKIITIILLLAGLAVTSLCVLVYSYSITPAQTTQPINLGPLAVTDTSTSLIDPAPINFTDNIADLLDETNRVRAENKVPLLSMNPKLNSSAGNKCSDMVKRNYWEHNDPDGKEPYRFITRAGVSYSKAGENLAYGFNNSRATIDGWMKSPSHKENMLSVDYTQVGFGICESKDFINQGRQIIVVQHLISPN